MSDAAYTARPTNKAMALERARNFSLPKDETGQYQHDEAVKYTELVKRELGGMFNMLDKQHGMSKLADKTPNKINTIKSTYAYDVTDILKDSKKRAKEESKRMGAVVTPDITTRSDAQEEADRLRPFLRRSMRIRAEDKLEWNTKA